MAKDKVGINAGQFYTECGKLNSGIVPRFYLGRVGEISEDTARLRRARVRSFWERCQQGERTTHETKVWLDSQHGWAKRIAKGVDTIVYGEDADPTQRQVLSVVTHVVEILNEQFAGVVHFVLARHITDYVKKIARRADAATLTPPDDNAATAGETLHTWLDEYADFALRTMLEINEESQQQEPTEWAKVYSDIVRRIKDWADPTPMNKFGYVQLECVVLKIASRPTSTKSDRPIAVKYANHALKALRRFICWLPKHAPPWKKPEDWEDIFAQYKPKMTNAEKSEKPIGKVKGYTVDQLVTIYRYATPFERCLLLLAINAGFGAAELSSLRLREVFLGNGEDNYIKRMRLKTNAGVYGEHWLFPHTVMAVTWAVARARKITGALTPASFIIVRDSGKRFVIKTKAGNRSNKAANAWQRLSDRIRDDDPQFPLLSFGKLRKTAGNLIKKASDGETVAVFHQRSSAVETDDEAEVYTDRLYERVFKAQRRVCKRLQPMFEAVPDPFPDVQTKNQIGLKKIDSIKEMWANGARVEAIMESTRVSRATAYRYKPEPAPVFSPTED